MEGFANFCNTTKNLWEEHVLRRAAGNASTDRLKDGPTDKIVPHDRFPHINYHKYVHKLPIYYAFLRGDVKKW